MVVDLLDTIAAAPVVHAQAVFEDSAGRKGYVHATRRLRLYYYVTTRGHVTFTDLRHIQPPRL